MVLLFTSTFGNVQNKMNFLDDAEVHQIWEIVGKALDRNNIVTSDNESLSVRVYDELSDED